jgi:T5SS/PEP-CTERM-associated repeat protein
LNINGGTISLGVLADNGTLTLADGLTLSNGLSMIAPTAGSGTVILSGTGSTWSPASLYVGGSDTAAGGAGTLALSTGATVNVAGAMTVWGSSGSSVTLSNGTPTPPPGHAFAAGCST